MKLYDEDFNAIDETDIDFETSFISLQSLPVSHRFIVDKEAQYEERILREYPETGGKDVEYVCISPEEGHWETRIAETGQLLDIDQNLDELGYDRLQLCEETIPVNIWRPCTQEELDARKAEKEAFELAERKRLENEKLLDDMPELLCSLYETTLSQQETIDTQNEVLCLMYEQMLEGGE